MVCNILIMKYYHNKREQMKKIIKIKTIIDIKLKEIELEDQTISLTLILNYINILILKVKNNMQYKYELYT